MKLVAVHPFALRGCVVTGGSSQGVKKTSDRPISPTLRFGSSELHSDPPRRVVKGG